MGSTKLLYLESFTSLNCDAMIQEVLEEDGKTIVILDQTIFYPQGGGQPYDKGIIQNESAKFLVDEVRYLDGVVRHIGRFEKGKFNAEDKVDCLVDKDKRQLNSRIHSAGHLVDMAMTQLGLNWVPEKGFHFPDGPYIEYNGSFEEQDREELLKKIEKSCNDFIKSDLKTKVLFMEKDEMKKVCHFVPDFLPEGKPGRVVCFGEFGVPCGGTHVVSLAEIKSMIIRKIKSNGEKIKVSYDVQR